MVQYLYRTTDLKIVKKLNPSFFKSLCWSKDEASSDYWTLYQKQGFLRRFRDPIRVPLPLPAGLHQHAWLLGRQDMHTFWRRCLASQRCRCWREGVPGQLPVGRRSWGVTPLGWCEITAKFVSACFTSCQIYLLVKNSFDKLDPMSKRSLYKSKQSCFYIAHTSCRTCLLQLLVTDNSFQSNIVKVAERSVSNRVFPNPKPVFFGYFQLPETRVFKKTGIAVAFKY